MCSDLILCPPAVPEGLESYRFTYTPQMLETVHKSQLRGFFLRLAVFLFCIAVILLMGNADPFLAGLYTGIISLGIITLLIQILVYRKTWKKTLQRVLSSEYQYFVADTYFVMCVSRDGQTYQQCRYDFADVQSVRQVRDLYLLQYGRQLHILPGSALQEGSGFYRLMNIYHTARNIQKPLAGKEKAWCIALCVCSLASLFLPLALSEVVFLLTWVYYDLFYLYFVLIPIPVLSILYGIRLKKKGVSFLAPILVGSIVLCMLLIYGFTL